jgi:tetratricopeptide (TPR) repeat protein
MKVINYIVIIAAILFLFACSSNKVETPVVPQEVAKTPLELALNAATEATDAYMEKDYETALTKFNTAIEQFNLAAPTATAGDSIPANIFRQKMNIAKTHTQIAYAASASNDFDGSAKEYLVSIDLYKNIKSQAAARDSIDSKIANLYLNTAITFKAAGEYQSAIEYFDLYLDSNPSDEQAANVINQKYYIYSDNLKDENMANQNLKDYAEKKNDFNSFFKLGDIYNEKKDFVNAIIWYEKARTVKQDINVLKKLANVYKNTTPKQLAKSNEILDKLIAINPSSPDTKAYYKMLGGNYKEMKNNAKAAEYFDKYLTIEYDEGPAFFMCSYYFDAKNYAKLSNYASMILANNPSASSQVNALLYRGIAKFNLNDKKGAKVDFERIQNDPKQGNTAKQYLKLCK